MDISSKYKAISKPIKVRWNSELKCLRRISKIKLSDLNEALELVDERNLRLSQSESSRLNDIIQILEPFEFVTNEIQGLRLIKFLEKINFCFLQVENYSAETNK